MQVGSVLLAARSRDDQPKVQETRYAGEPGVTRSAEGRVQEPRPFCRKHTVCNSFGKQNADLQLTGITIVTFTEAYFVLSLLSSVFIVIVRSSAFNSYCNTSCMILKSPFC